MSPLLAAFPGHTKMQHIHALFRYLFFLSTVLLLTPSLPAVFKVSIPTPDICTPIKAQLVLRTFHDLHVTCLLVLHNCITPMTPFPPVIQYQLRFIFVVFVSTWFSPFVFLPFDFLSSWLLWKQYQARSEGRVLMWLVCSSQLQCWQLGGSKSWTSGPHFTSVLSRGSLWDSIDRVNVVSEFSWGLWLLFEYDLSFSTYLTKWLHWDNSSLFCLQE